jgi:hypothetical protein
MLQSDGLEQFEGAICSLRSGTIRFKHRNLHVFERREAGEQVKGLKDKANLAGPVG